MESTNDLWTCNVCGEPSVRRLCGVPVCRADLVRIVDESFDEADWDVLANYK